MSRRTTRVIGIDPGSIRCGLAVVERSGSSLRRIHSRTIECGRGAFSERLTTIHAEILSSCDEWAPDVGAIEGIFHHRNSDSALKLGHARGVAILALTQSGLEVTELAPAVVKKSLGTTGRASKEQVRRMVCMLLNLQTEPGYDESDALAIAIARLHQSRIRGRGVL